MHLVHGPTFPQVNGHRNEFSVAGARMRPNRMGTALWRSRSMSSMLSAPAIILAARQETFSCACPFEPGVLAAYATPIVPGQKAPLGSKRRRGNHLGNGVQAWMFPKLYGFLR